MKGNNTVHYLLLSLHPHTFFKPKFANFEKIQDRTYAAELGVGLRGVTYHAHGEKFWFNPDTVEDVAGERWVYSKKLWCAGK